MNDDDTSMSTYLPDIEWTREHEKILIDWADKAMCYRWLHDKSNVLYTKLNTWYTIPVIIISTLTGTANFAQDRIPDRWHSAYVMAVGGFNILAGIITTIQQFLKITQLNEAHRVSSIAWDKFYRNIKIELAKHPSERIHVTHMIKMCKEEFDRMIETSPIISDKITRQFKQSFKNTECYNQISKPAICDELISTSKFRNPWLNDDNIRTRSIEQELKNKQQMEEQENTFKDEISKISLFENTFKQLNNREPLDDEIIDNMKDVIPLEDLNKILLSIRDEKNTYEKV
jgi:hypothetical protein